MVFEPLELSHWRIPLGLTPELEAPPRVTGGVPQWPRHPQAPRDTPCPQVPLTIITELGGDVMAFIVTWLHFQGGGGDDGGEEEGEGGRGQSHPHS